MPRQRLETFDCLALFQPRPTHFWPCMTLQEGGREGEASGQVSNKGGCDETASTHFV